MKTYFSSESSGEWRITLESESVPEIEVLKDLFQKQPLGVPCDLQLNKANDGDQSARFMLFSPRRR